MHGEARAEVGDVVEAAGADELVEEASGERAHARLERGDVARRERAAHELAVARVHRWVHEDHEVLHEVVGFLAHHLEHRRVRGAERVRVEVRAQHVVEAAQRVEVESFVVIDGRLLA